MKKDSAIQSVVFVALFAALTFIATQFIHIPTPGAFVHMGNAVLLLAVLLIGYTRGALAGGFGFFIFDVMNGYASEAPYFVLESFIVGGAAYLTYKAFHKDLDKIWKVLAVGVVTGIAKLIMTQIKNTVMLLIMGSTFSAAFGGALIKLPATMINVTITLFVVALVYYPLKKTMDSILHRVA